MLRIAVIGAGAGGLCVGRHLSSHPEKFRFDIFEKTGDIGGTWVYTDQIGEDENKQPIHSSMYANLRTNLPKEVMAFPGFPFNQDLPSFIHHTEVRKYLQQYANHHQLLKYIKMFHSVDNISPVKATSDHGERWEVSVKELKSGNSSSEIYDAVFICNGHYSTPATPHIKGLDTFTGHVLHSHDYRRPDGSIFTRNSSVVCLGAGSSGQDIGIELSKHVSKVYLSHDRPSPLTARLPLNMEQRPGVAGVAGGRVLFKDGGEVECDVLLLCTGYDFVFPFLSHECEVEVAGNRLPVLYKHLVNMRHPSMFLIGIPLQICPFPLFDVQTRFCVQVLLGSHHLPSSGEMAEDTEREYQGRLARGIPHRHAHKMGSLQWDYNRDLCQLASLEPVPTVVEELYDYVHDMRTKDLCHYKSANYRLISGDQFETVGQ